MTIKYVTFSRKGLRQDSAQESSKVRPMKGSLFNWKDSSLFLPNSEVRTEGLGISEAGEKSCPQSTAVRNNDLAIKDKDLKKLLSNFPKTSFIYTGLSMGKNSS